MGRAGDFTSLKLCTHKGLFQQCASLQAVGNRCTACFGPLPTTSLEHDVAGAAAAGIASVFVLGGIHAEDVRLAPAAATAAAAAEAEQQRQQQHAAQQIDGNIAAAGSYTFSEQRLAEVCSAHGAVPTYLLPYFA